MTPGAPPQLTATQLNALEAAHQLLRQGRASDAATMVRRVTNDAPWSGDATQLLAMCLADTGDVDGAEASFLRALELAPRQPGILFNFGTWLTRQGRKEEAAERYHAATMAEPGFVGAWIKLGVAMLELGYFAKAAWAFQHAVDLQPEALQAWQGLGRAKRSLGDLDAAASALRKATSLSGGDSSPWVDLGTTQQSLGQLDEALASFEQAQRLGETHPAVSDVINGLLADLGRTKEAIEQGRRLVITHPLFIPAQVKLAQLLWTQGNAGDYGEDPFSTIRISAQQQPGNDALQREFISLLIEARKSEEALDRVRALRRANSDDLSLVWMEALACDLLALHEEAGRLYALAYPTLRLHSAAFLNAYARHAYQARDWDAVARHANEAIALDPTNQESWAHLGTAWRLIGDPREHWLMDYERLISMVEVEPMPMCASQTESLELLKATLDGMHLAGRDPLNQSVRGGSQTPGRLFVRPDPIIAKARATLQAAAECWLATLPADPTHPFLSRNQHGVKMGGSWSVKLGSFGHHSNHIHQEGWMSSAFYVSLPPSVSDESGGQAGCIQFGQPTAELGLDLPPRRVIRPKPGYLAVFPSYMWHGTVPFSDSEPRMTIAFDMLPAPRA